MAQATASVQTYTCQACGEEWSRPTARGQRPKWCPDCRARAIRSPRRCPVCAEVKPFRAGNTFCSQRCFVLSKQPSSPLFLIECEGDCGRLWASKTPTTRTCRGCKIAQRKPATPPKITFVNGPCSRCGTWFTTYTADGCDALARFCSERCGKADAKDRERARSFGVELAPFSRWRIFEDHDWTCWLCRESIDKTLTDHQDSGYGTLDHVVPLALGGRHAPDNLLPAHRLCNSLKGIEQVGLPY